MSKELIHILSLTKDLDQVELSKLMNEISKLIHQGNEAVEIPDEEKKIVRERFARIDRGEVALSPWEEVKKRVFGK